MRHNASFTSLSWIPSEAIPGLLKIPMVLGISHYDQPPPGHLDDLEALHAAGSFRFANPLQAWIEVEDGRIVDAGYEGGGLISKTVASLGVTEVTIPPVPFPDLRADPEWGDGWVRFEQTVGGRTGAPIPRRVNRPPFVQITAPTVWTTLALKIHGDGRSEYEIVGASPFPRHWFYDADGNLVKKSGIADYKEWAGEMFGEKSPWGNYQHELLVADAESELERILSKVIMQGGNKPEIRRLRSGMALTQQGEEGDELYLVLDGVLSVEVDGEAVAEVGPGTILGERAILEGGMRTSTLRAVTPVKVAVARSDQIDRQALLDLARGHHREIEAE
ncbi:MAG: cyclic nucleotide-binding domain-containing protein [Acidimicrobiia bacterium]